MMRFHLINVAHHVKPTHDGILLPLMSLFSQIFFPINLRIIKTIKFKLYVLYITQNMSIKHGVRILLKSLIYVCDKEFFQCLIHVIIT